MSREVNWIVCSIPRTTLYPTDLLDDEDLCENKINDKRTWEQVVEKTLREVGISDAIWTPTKNDHKMTVSFPMDISQCDAALNYLHSKGIGIKKGTSVGLIPFSLYLESDERRESDPSDDDDVL